MISFWKQTRYVTQHAYYSNGPLIQYSLAIWFSFEYPFQWATDQDIANAIQEVGVTDFQDVKFFENRANGQSKGFCVISLGSDQSLRMVLDRLPKKDLHGQHPVVTLPTKQVNIASLLKLSDANGRKHLTTLHKSKYIYIHNARFDCIDRELRLVSWSISAFIRDI